MQTMSEYLTSEILPALQNKRGRALLSELVRRSKNHAVMNDWFRKLFVYLVSSSVLVLELEGYDCLGTHLPY